MSRQAPRRRREPTPRKRGACETLRKTQDEVVCVRACPHSEAVPRIWTGWCFGPKSPPLARDADNGAGSCQRWPVTRPVRRARSLSEMCRVMGAMRRLVLSWSSRVAQTRTLWHSGRDCRSEATGRSLARVSQKSSQTEEDPVRVEEMGETVLRCTI